LSPLGDLASTVESASAVYFAITLAAHEYFDQTLVFAARINLNPFERPFKTSHIRLKDGRKRDVTGFIRRDDL
jgi:hypothetical protein